MHDQGNGTTFQEKAAQALGVLALLCTTLAVSVQPILHCRMGRNALGMPALFAMIAVPCWGLLFPGDDLRPLGWFWCVFIAGCLWNRVFRAPAGEHTRYSGVPRLHVLFRRMDETKLKGVVEPLVVLAIGVALYPTSAALGSYLVAAAFGLAGSVSFSAAELRARMDQLCDSRIEQEQLAVAFRQLHGE